MMHDTAFDPKCDGCRRYRNILLEQAQMASMPPMLIDRDGFIAVKETQIENLENLVKAQDRLITLLKRWFIGSIVVAFGAVAYRMFV